MSRVAILVGEGYEDSEFQVPYDRLRAAGHEVTVLGSERGAEVHGKRGESHIEIEHTPGEVRPEQFEALVIPGGNGPDRLRLDQASVDFTRDYYQSGRPLAAICHGPQLLIEADVVEGHTLTSWPSLRTDLLNAGAHWKDREVVEDANFITSRQPDDLDSFCKVLLQRLAHLDATAG